jgi:hypothetical protein
MVVKGKTLSLSPHTVKCRPYEHTPTFRRHSRL